MANKSTQKRWKTWVETPSAPSSAPSTFSLQVAAFRRQRSQKPGMSIELTFAEMVNGYKEILQVAEPGSRFNVCLSELEAVARESVEVIVLEINSDDPRLRASVLRCRN